MKLPLDYAERIYAGILGMNMGIQLGAPVESPLWTYERLEKTYGDIRGPIRHYRNFAADDDVNGPAFFVRAFYDDAKEGELTPQDVGRAWLNYTREGKGMFWWGGYGISTEHTAYLNLKAGIPAPRSGSMQQNGRRLAEQIGGQIFIDSFGMLYPGMTKKAADCGQCAASVSHDGEGLNGARFFCAAIAAAFEETDIKKVIERALCEVPASSSYAAVFRAVKAFYEKNPKDFRACRLMLERDFGYDRYEGNCPIIPNAGICALSLYYGEGDLGRSIELAVMCGWDTDCNAGNVGTVLGILGGVEGLPERYRKEMNDRVILSSVCGSLNMLDLPTFAKELACLGAKLNHEERPAALRDFQRGAIHFDFAFPGSTHGMRSNRYRMVGEGGALCIYLEQTDVLSDGCVFYKPYYQREDFEDARYDPVFSPQVYSGQVMRAKLRLEVWQGEGPLGVIPFVRCADDGRRIEGAFWTLKSGEDSEICFELPDTAGACIDEVGFRVVGNGYFTDTSGILRLHSFTVEGSYQANICFARQSLQFGNVAPFSQNGGYWGLCAEGMEAMSLSKAQSFTGYYYIGDQSIACPVTPLAGGGHMLAVRMQGVMRGYYGGFSERGKAAIYREYFGEKKLAETDFAWKDGEVYEMKLQAEGDRMSLWVNGSCILEVRDDIFTFGMVGCARLSAGRCVYGDMQITGTPKTF